MSEPKVTHVAVRALEALKGIIRVDSLPYMGEAHDVLHCGHPVWPGPTHWVSVHSVNLWKKNQLLAIPNCPSCSVAWDEALECYYARKQAST